MTTTNNEHTILSCIIIDDTPQAISVLRNLLEKYFTEVRILSIANDVQQGITLIKEQQPDIVFLDVEMPGENGTALFDYIDQPSFETIFTTAFPDYAADAFRLKSIDYLVKPIKPSQLKEAISRVKEKRSSSNQHNILQLPEGGGEKKISFSSMDSIEIFSLKEILYCSAENNYTTVVTTNKEIIVSKNIGFYEQLLLKHGFCRVNRSTLVNLEHVVRIEKTGSQELVVSNGFKILISSRRKKDLLETLKRYTLDQNI